MYSLYIIRAFLMDTTESIAGEICIIEHVLDKNQQSYLNVFHYTNMVKWPAKLVNLLYFMFRIGVYIFVKVMHKFVSINEGVACEILIIRHNVLYKNRQSNLDMF